MTIFQAIGAARHHVVEGGGFGPSGAMGRFYLRASHELLKAGVGLFDEVANEVFNEEQKLHEYLNTLKVKANQQEASLQPEPAVAPEEPQAPASAPGAPEIPSLPEETGLTG